MRLDIYVCHQQGTKADVYGARALVTSIATTLKQAWAHGAKLEAAPMFPAVSSSSPHATVPPEDDAVHPNNAHGSGANDDATSAFPTSNSTALKHTASMSSSGHMVTSYEEAYIATEALCDVLATLQHP
jgi:hypothetical protein